MKLPNVIATQSEEKTFFIGSPPQFPSFFDSNMDLTWIMTWNFEAGERALTNYLIRIILYLGIGSGHHS
jgi:hypothetical protein